MRIPTVTGGTESDGRGPVSGLGRWSETRRLWSRALEGLESHKLTCHPDGYHRWTVPTTLLRHSNTATLQVVSRVCTIHESCTSITIIIITIKETDMKIKQVQRVLESLHHYCMDIYRIVFCFSLISEVSRLINY